MRIHKFLAGRAILISCLLLMLAVPQASFSQQAAPTPAPAAAPLAASPSITLAEARVIIEAALAFARQRNLLMSVVVLDTAGEVVSADRIDGSSASNMHFAEGKAFAALMLRQTTEVLGDLAKSRPDRYFGIMNMYPGKVYLVGGGEPLAINSRLVGAVGIAGMPQGVDEMAGRAGMAAWDKYRAGKP
jgi:glc operon protein GlcG